jgi:epoxyqueuosine reductase
MYMMKLLMQEASVHGDKLQMISIKHLHSIKNEIELFKENEALNGFQKWIVNDMYKLEKPVLGFTIKSIIIIAIPHPSYARVEFTRQGKKYNFISLIKSDFDNTEKYLNNFLEPKGYHIKSAQSLPLKRLAARCGLAVYGRNNICYVEGMGSFLSFAAYFSDIPCDNDDLTQMNPADTCTNCRVCFNNCPTGAIRTDRFLIDNEKCLSYFNETEGELPEWIPISVHHCLYDCLKCQINCPMNKEYVNNVTGPIKFSENETDILLSGSPFESFSPTLKYKSKILGLDDWLGAIPRNLNILFELS